jgi:hypothetical protein
LFSEITGLPPDITVDEFIQLMSKFGIIMRDPQTEEFKVKLYKDDQGNLKGDGLCCYLKVGIWSSLSSLPFLTQEARLEY